jgi:hypothetical protein
MSAGGYGRARSSPVRGLGALLAVAATALPASAGSGYLISPPLRIVPALASGLVRAECAVLNRHATKTAHVSVVVRDSNCLSLGSSDLIVGPGEHAAASIVASSPPTSIICAIDLNQPSNQVGPGSLLASFSVLTLTGQPRSAVQVERRIANLPA